MQSVSRIPLAHNDRKDCSIAMVEVLAQHGDSVELECRSKPGLSNAGERRASDLVNRSL